MVEKFVNREGESVKVKLIVMLIVVRLWIGMC